jgi:hypothetical protein
MQIDPNNLPPAPEHSIDACADVEWLTSDRLEQAITEGLAWYGMTLGYAEITEDNWCDVYARIDLLERLSPPMVMGWKGEVHHITPDDVRRRIGMTLVGLFADLDEDAWVLWHGKAALAQFRTQASLA